MRRIIAAIMCCGVATYAGATALDDDTTRDPEGTIIESGGLGVFAIEAGDCVQFPEGDSSLVAAVEGVPCASRHDAQLYAEFDLTGEDFPGQSAVEKAAFKGCEARWAEALHTEWEDDPDHDLSMLSPTGMGWHFSGDREVQCFVVRIDGEPITGDLLDGDS